MSPRSPLSLLRRLLLALLAVVQMGSPVLATAAHAQLARATTGDVARVHLEEPGQRHTIPGHPESCVLCQMLGRVLSVPVEPAAISDAQSPQMAQAWDNDEQVVRAPSARHRTRAPPASV